MLSMSSEVIAFVTIWARSAPLAGFGFDFASVTGVISVSLFPLWNSDSCDVQVIAPLKTAIVANVQHPDFDDIDWRCVCP
jgi:hypothetical protein